MFYHFNTTRVAGQSESGIILGGAAGDSVAEGSPKPPTAGRGSGN